MHHRRAYCTDSAHHPKHHFKRKFRKMMEHKMKRGGRGHFPKVNVQELDDRYELFVYAAGYAKADFKVDLTDDTLIISANIPKRSLTTIGEDKSFDQENLNGNLN